MTPEAPELPAPSPAARAHSAALARRIRDEIARAGGWIRFDRYMQMALYEPGLGYYSGGSVKLGSGGDFTTAAELGPLLPRSIAALCDGLCAQMTAPTILELGAGTGALAAHLLRSLDDRGRREVDYRILETSADLRARQQHALRAFGERVTWLDALPEGPIEGLILANEVVDALPVVRFVKQSNGGVRPLGVVASNAAFGWQTGREDPELSAAVSELESRLGAPLPDAYRSEICLLLPAWLASLSASLARGAVLLIDYGLPRREYYHAQRGDGTLICHYRHRAHDDPFWFPGLQDISAWVDFSACADAAAQAGLDVSGYTTQGQFLVAMAGSGGIDLASQGIAELSQIKTLLLPGEMGERFKVLLLTRGLAECRLPGRDFRRWL